MANLTHLFLGESNKIKNNIQLSSSHESVWKDGFINVLSVTVHFLNTKGQKWVRFGVGQCMCVSVIECVDEASGQV